MKLKNDILFSAEFAKAFEKLMKLAFPATIAIQLVGTSKVLNEKQKDIFQVRDVLLERLAKKNENGQIKTTDTGIEFIDQNSSDEFFSEMESLLNLEFDIPLVNKLKLDDRIQISAQEILILRPVLDIDI